MNISLELYKVFVAVAKNSSFSKAAQEIFVSQSAISQAIKNLEEILGFPLFIRSTKKVSLTLKGKILYDDLKLAFNIITSAESKILEFDNPFGGELTIAATDTLCKYYLLDKMKEIQQKYPHIKIKVINGSSFYCLGLLEEGQIDFAVVNIPANLDILKYNVEKKYIFKDVFVSSYKYPIKNKITLKELLNYPLLLLDEKSYTRHFLNKLFAKYNLTISPYIELQNIDILIEMTKIGLGIAFVPDLCLKKQMLKEIQIKENLPEREYGIIALKKIPLSGLAKTFVAYM